MEPHLITCIKVVEVETRLGVPAEAEAVVAGTRERGEMGPRQKIVPVPEEVAARVDLGQLPLYTAVAVAEVEEHHESRGREDNPVAAAAVEEAIIRLERLEGPV